MEKVLDLLIKRQSGLELLMETRVDDILRDEDILGEVRQGRRSAFGSPAMPTKVANRISRMVIPQSRDDVFVNTVGPEEFALVQFALVAFVDFLFVFFVHIFSSSLQVSRSNPYVSEEINSGKERPRNDD